VKKKNSLIRRVFTHAAIWLNVLAVIWLFTCYLSSSVSPADIRNIALFSLTTPFAIVANIGFVFLWLFSPKKLRALLSIFGLIICFKMIPAVIGMGYFQTQDWSERPGAFKIMSWNVHGMGIFTPQSEKQHAAGIIKFIRQEDPDILCLPEFSVKALNAESKYLKELVKDRYRYYRFDDDNSLGTTVLLGTAFLSKYPILSYKVYELDPYIHLLQCDLKPDKKTMVRVLVAHLHSFGLTDRDKAYIEKVKAKETDIESDLGTSRSFIWKFNEAYIFRAREADKIAAVVRNSPYPVLLCGDFNDLPYSYTWTTVKGHLDDAFIRKGRGLGRTYNQIIPTLRIDHIFYDPAVLSVLAFKTRYSALSDHSPVIANFEIIKPAQD
jgi:endonuclease/exonuclease/phosphatase family metal-dependent hydrolase